MEQTENQGYRVRPGSCRILKRNATDDVLTKGDDGKAGPPGPPGLEGLAGDEFR